MQSAVLELVDRAERQRAELVQLPYAPQVEEGVAVHHAFDAPQRDAEPGAGERDESADPRSPSGAGPRTEGERQGDRTGDQHERKRQIERAVDGEGDRERPCHECTRPGERTDRAGAPERARDEAARDEQHEGRGEEPEPEAEPLLGQEAGDAEKRHGQQQQWSPVPQAHPIRSATGADPSQAAASRYMRPRSPRISTPRRRSEKRSRRRPRSA